VPRPQSAVGICPVTQTDRVEPAPSLSGREGTSPSDAARRWRNSSSDLPQGKFTHERWKSGAFTPTPAAIRIWAVSTLSVLPQAPVMPRQCWRTSCRRPSRRRAPAPRAHSSHTASLRVMPGLQRQSSARVSQGSTPSKIGTTMALIRLRASAIVTSGRRPSGMSLVALPATRAQY
jgi:hypothetical protein